MVRLFACCKPRSAPVSQAPRWLSRSPMAETNPNNPNDGGLGDNDGSNSNTGDTLSLENVALDLSMPPSDRWGDWTDAILEGAYRREHMLPELRKHFRNGALCSLIAATIFTLISFATLGPGFGLTLAATTWVISLVGVTFASASKRFNWSLEVTEAGIITLMCIILSLPITPARVSNLMGQTGGDGYVGVDTEEDMQLVTIRFCIFLFYCAVLVPLRPRRFAVVNSFTFVANVAQELLLAPGALATNVRDSIAITLVILFAYWCRRHIFHIDRAQWHFHRRVHRAVRERYEEERTRVRERLELTKTKAGKEARSRLIRVAMHDLRSPLLSVHSLSKTLLVMDQNQPISQISEMLNALGALSSLMEAIVSDMLDFERIDSGRIAVVKQPFFIADVLEGADATFASVATVKGVELRIEPLPEALARPRRFYGDARRLAQALNNGCSNAVKFTDSGGVVTVSAWLAAAPSQTKGSGWSDVRIRVVDTGSGLSAAELNTLQQGGIFTQVGRGQLQGNGGTGLGLSIAKELLKLHDNSELRLHSEGEGKGTTFEIMLVLKDAPPLEEDADEVGTIVPTAAPTRVTAASGGGDGQARHQLAEAPPVPASDPSAATDHPASPDGQPVHQAPSELPPLAETAAEVGLHRARSATHQPLTPAEAAPMPPVPASTPLGGRQYGASNQKARAKSTVHMVQFPPGFRCLHVEDDKFVQMTLPLSTFALVGAAHDTANDGEQALQMVEQREYNLILMDNQMPKLTGTEATRILRERGFKNPIIGMTGDPEGSDDRLAFEQAGLDACVDKTSAGTSFVVQELRKLAAAGAADPAQRQQ